MSVRPADWWNPGDWVPNIGDRLAEFFRGIGNFIIGPLKDIGLVAGVSMGIVVFFTTYHRKAIVAGAKQAGTYVIQQGGQALREAPLLLA